MYPKSFIQLYQEVRKILEVQVRCLQDTDTQTDLVLEVAPPEVGHLKMAQSTDEASRLSLYSTHREPSLCLLNYE